MKCLLKALIVFMGAIALVPPASANEENLAPIVTDPGQASALVTQPLTINSGARNSSNRTENLRQVADSIRLVREGGCKKLDPFELLKDPGPKLKQCLQEKPTQDEIPKPDDQIQYFKVPRLDSGVRIQLTQF
ncbi:MAG: hypothetical protein SAK29_12415 [Scytonema sp. PMC 1069.18]|nr:hypothetical protein [Scytonema sp. PMC 1069.18]MEC4885913.1 hypothetical protein [Scytonema sp. PMC 1070.18]